MATAPLTTSTTPPQMITHKPNLKLSLATPSDITSIRKLWYTVFTGDFIRQLFPETPSVYKWWDDHNGTDLQKPAAKYLVVKDVSEEGKGIVVGYAKWWVPVGDERLVVEDRFPAWPAEGSKELLDAFFGNMAKERKEFMGDKQYCYLDMLGTLAEYRRLGVGNQLVSWGTEQADKDGVECFVDSSEAGLSLYKKFGFVPEASFIMPGQDFSTTSCIRPAKK